MATAIERQRPPPGGDVLWGGVQATMSQHERESQTVRALLRADGADAWRPDARRLPAARPANASMEQLLEHVPVGGTAWLAFGNAGVTEMLLNWVAHVIERGYGKAMVIAAFDEPLLLTLHSLRVPVYNYSGALPPTHFRHAPYLFHRMGFLKAELITHVLRAGRHALVSDSDVAWRADPREQIRALLRMGANLGASTDCLDVSADADKTERAASPGACGHAPGNTRGAVFNTGVLWFRSHPSTIEFARRWAAATLALTDPYSDDQGAFNRLLTSGLYPVAAAPGTRGRVIRGAGGLLIAPLPADRFCSGHLVHVQRAGDPSGCVAVHATFTEYGDAGKKWRFLEARLWATLPDAYYSSGRYLTFVPPAAPADPQPCPPGVGLYVNGSTPRPCGGEDPRHGLGAKRLGNIPWREGLKRSSRLRAQVSLASRQVHALRDALGIARVLNRTLILPHFECMCDRSEDAEIMPSCIYPGAPPAMRVPFRCSQHFVADTHKLQLMHVAPSRFGMQPHKFGGAVAEPIHLRAFSFLEDPRAARLAAGVVDVRVEPRGGGALGGGFAGADAESESDGADGPTLPRGVTNERARQLLGPWDSASVLRLSDAEGVFGGWVSERLEATLFNTMMDYYVYRGAWCCTSRNTANQDEGRVYLTPPPPLLVPPR